MPEYHPGTDVEILPGVAASGFRCAIPNVKRYTRRNRWTAEDVARAAYEGDYERLEALLSTGDAANLFNGDLNEHVEAEEGLTRSWYTALQMAAIAGQTECIELLLEAKADPHVRERAAFGRDPDEGRTALDFAREREWDDCVELLEQAEKDCTYGWYVPTGPENNAKCYSCWEWGAAPPRGWHLQRPGAAKRQGLDPAKYGGELADPESEAEGPAAREESALKPLPIGIVFPGQGSQYVKMLAAVADVPAVQEMLAKAQEIVGYDVLQLCRYGPDEELEETPKCQVAVFVAGLAGLEKLRLDREEVVVRCQAMAGLSLGEYTALCAAGVFGFEDCLRLVKARGALMHEAATTSGMLMLTVAGLDKAALARLAEQAAVAAGEGAVCQIASELFPKGLSVAGTEEAVLVLKDMAEAAGAMQAKVLRSTAGFSTPLMMPARDKFSEVLDEVRPRMKSPRVAVYMNATAEPIKPGTDPSVILGLLKEQMTSPVLWEPTVRAMMRDGVSQFYEVGPMKQLKAMMKRIDPKMWGAMWNVEV